MRGSEIVAGISPDIRAVVWVENAMKTIVGVLASLVIVGIAALGMLTAQQLSSPPDRVANATAAQPSAFMTPWPDLNDLTTSVSAVSVASVSAEQRSSSPPVVSERAAQTQIAATHQYVPAQHHSRTKKNAHKHRRG
jgi:hypothetical protein